MKLLKKIAALLSAVTIFGMSAMAADFTFTDVKYKAGDETISVSLYAKSNVLSFEGGSSLMITYNTDLTYVKASSSAYSSAIELIDDQQTPGQIALNIKDDIEDIDTSKAICTLTFTVNGDPTGYEFKTKNIVIFDVTAECDLSTENISVVVTKDAPAEPVPGTTTEAVVLDGTEKYMTVVDDSKATRYVVMDEKLSVPATGATVLKATYNGVTKQANLAKLLGVTIEEDGNINIGKLTIKMVLPEGAAQPTADIFGFVVE